MFRTVNVGIVNELALCVDRLNVDVWEVINAARTKPFGFMPFYPGPGERAETSLPGAGHVPPSPGGYVSPFMDLAARVDAGMPRAVLDLVSDALNTHSKPVRGSSVLVAGLARGCGADSLSESPGLDVMNVLAAKGAVLTFADPTAAALPATAWAGGIELRSLVLTPQTIADADCVVILADHGALDTDAIVAHGRLVVDVRNATGGASGSVFRLGAPRPRNKPPLPHRPPAKVTVLPLS